jgi:hypothetical protein
LGARCEVLYALFFPFFSALIFAQRSLAALEIFALAAADMTHFLPVPFPLPGRPLNGSLIRTTESSNAYLNPIQLLL